VAPKTYEFPIAGWKPLPVSSTHLEAMMLRGPVAIDSTSAIGAWPGATAANALILNKAPDGAVLMPPSMAWLAWDASSLYVAIHNDVNPAKPLASQAHWGVNDAVEVALRDSSKPHSPILVWRGYPNGKFETSTEAGASIEAANRALLGVQYVARIENSASWDATWRIPFASIGIDPGKTKQLDCNLSVRKTADDQWVMWQSTGGYTWDVDHAGRLVLAVPAKNTAHSLGDGQKF